MNWNQVPKANEAFCLDMYKNAAAPSMAGKKGDLFSGLNQTVKVKTKQKLKKRTFVLKVWFSFAEHRFQQYFSRQFSTSYHSQAQSKRRRKYQSE